MNSNPYNKQSKNEGANILSAWIALEVLSPQTFNYPEDLVKGNRKLIATFEEGILPWKGRGEKVKPGTQLFYQVILGVIDYEKAISSLLDIYVDKRIEKPRTKGEAILAVAVVDNKGCLVNGATPITISSFAWGLNKALNKDLPGLEAWHFFEENLLKKITPLLRRFDKKGDPIPVDISIIEKVSERLLTLLEIPRTFIKKTFFAIRNYEYYKNLDPPEPLLLNSFYISDLALTKSLILKDKITGNIKRYLGIDLPIERFDLLDNPKKLEEIISPAFIPAARWPSANSQPLVLMQQAAVNLAFKELKDEGIIAINGPPGTGKSTLLRDIVAGLVTQRAELMSGFNDPATAFIHSGQSIQLGQAWLHLYRLDNKLKGFEMLIASSNNKAVENISAELPAIDAIANDKINLRYFNVLSDTLLGRDTWGLIAAILGNSANRNYFKQTFWWNKDVGLSTYLAAASGTPQFIEIKDPKTNKIIGCRRPKIVVECDAPFNHEEALKRWHKVRAEFQVVLEKSKAKISELEEIRKILLHPSNLIREEVKAEAALKKAISDEILAQEKLAEIETIKLKAKINVQEAEQPLSQHYKLRPGFFQRLFRRPPYILWKQQQKVLLLPYNNAKKILEGVVANYISLQNILNNCKTAREKIQKNYEIICKTNASLKQKIHNYELKLGKQIINDNFFSLPHEQKHNISPWCDEAIHSIRNEVFISAINLHKAFIDAAAKPLRHNLGVLMQIFSGHTLSDIAKTNLLPDLWSSLFLVVPSISTTFASVRTMLGRLPPKALGWLLIDEAGQALPQAAIGPLLRTKRAIIVGDPLQIEPIVTLPETLTKNICLYFKVDPDLFNAPDASVQTLADITTPYYTEIQSKNGSRYLGIPLLVHRRCAEPMFSIANAVAYERLMVQAKKSKNSQIRDCLGASCWIDVQGEAHDKWCPNEGEIVLNLLRKLKDANIIPNLYIITPFIIVATNLRNMIKDSKILQSWVNDDKAWCSNHIGTVHTVQGREAEAVIFVLGAPAVHQTGARNWAGSKPNLLNVAVTRAKEALYVIGNKQLWSEAGIFKELVDRI